MRACRLTSIRTGAVLIAGLALLLCPGARAQGSRADYERAAALRAASMNKVFRSQVDPHWLPGGSAFWYEVGTGPHSREYLWVDAEKGLRRPAFDHARLAQALNVAGVAVARSDSLEVSALEWPGNNTLGFIAAGKQWRVSLENYAILEEKPVSSPALTALPLGELPAATRRNGPETSLRFINHTSGPVQLLWLDHEGERRPYGTILPGQSHDQSTFGGHVWLITNTDHQTIAAFEAADAPRDAEITGTASPRPSQPAPSAAKRPAPPVRSPDGQWEASIKDYNVVLRAVATGREEAVTTEGRPNNPYRDGAFFWSRDSQKLVAVRVEPGQEHKVSLINSSPKDQVQPKVVTFDYLKPGDKLPHPRPTLIDVGAQRAIPIDDTLFPNPFTEDGRMDIRWSDDSSHFTFRYNQRGHQVLRIIGVDATTGAARAIVDEQSTTFIDYSGKFFREDLDETGELIWMSERDGWNHLYLYDAKSGAVKNQITRGNWVVRRVDRVDREHRQIWFLASGIIPGQDPYYVHSCRVNFDGSSLVILTAGNGPHVTLLSPDQRFIVDTYSRVDLAPMVELRRARDGQLVCELEQGDASALWSAGRRTPERFSAKGRDGETDIYGIIVPPQISTRPENIRSLKTSTPVRTAHLCRKPFPPICQ